MLPSYAISFVVWLAPLALFAAGSFIFLGVLSDLFYGALVGTEPINREEVAASMISLLVARLAAAGGMIGVATIGVCTFSIGRALPSRGNSEISFVRPLVGFSAVVVVYLIGGITLRDPVYLVQTAIWIPSIACILFGLTLMPETDKLPAGLTLRHPGALVPK